MRVALDTNILANAEGVDAAVRQRLMLQLLRDLPHDRVVIPVRVLGELFSVLTRKARLQQTVARTALLSWRDNFPVPETTPKALLAAADLATDHHSAFGMRSSWPLPRRPDADCSCPMTSRTVLPGEA